jgi:HSP20 family protein
MATQQDQQKAEQKEDDGKTPPPQQPQEAAQPASGQAIARPLPTTGPFAIVRQLFEDLEQMWSGVRRPARGPMDVTAFHPQIEISERDHKIVVKADLPGVTPDDIEVTLRDDALIIEGERHSEHEHQQGNVWRTERVYGGFRRVIPLPEGVDPNSVEAQFNNGVLEVSLATPQKESGGRKVEIQSQQRQKVQH